MRRKYLIILLPISLLLANISAFFPNIVERIYSNGVYPIIGQSLSIITGFLPFSVAEVIVILLFLLIILSLIRTIILLIRGKGRRKETALRYFVNALALGSVIYFGFVIIWGLNYNRLPFSDIANFNVQPITVQELAKVCEDLVDKANALRDMVSEDENGVMQISGGKASVFRRASVGYELAAGKYPELGGRYGPPKGVFISKLMSYAGIGGVYFPFTGEANVNTLTPDSALPSTATHEMAHQRGFAREDEANYIAYVTSTLHPDPDFQYSGTFLALRHTMNTLRRYDLDEYNKLRARYNEGIERDLADLAAFWEKYEGSFERLSSEINDLYLKSNRQEEGIYSYNRMVDLLVAEYREKLIIGN
ncbi:MAG: hypothetical protein VR72_01580 [Clostridiaceae bacterium BRH_c20a]|nr:MAG: hypothetical protein VR72_01580 [Clostridiaceae bacterium BRH_c20a]